MLQSVHIWMWHVPKLVIFQELGRRVYADRWLSKGGVDHQCHDDGDCDRMWVGQWAVMLFMAIFWKDEWVFTKRERPNLKGEVIIDQHKVGCWRSSEMGCGLGGVLGGGRWSTLRDNPTPLVQPEWFMFPSRVHQTLIVFSNFHGKNYDCIANLSNKMNWNPKLS